VNSKPNPYGLTNYESRLIENGEQCDSIYGYTSKFRCVYGRAGSKPEMIVIHFTAGPNSDSALQQLELDNNSAHYIIEKNGKVIQQVLEEDIARHAGVDQDQIRDRIIKPNDRAIGIEIVNRGFVSSSMPGAVFFPWQPHSNYPINNYWDPYTQAQYDSLKTLINGIKTTWNIQKVVYKPSPINYQPNPTSSGSNIDNLSLFNGLLGHSVISDDRADPGPIFDWSKVIAP
jgi:N-acetyl-anhydromuramyl-L-alanine amidase AmpD